VVLFCAINAFSQVISFEIGGSYFLGDLQKEVKSVPYFGGSFEIPISYYTTGFLNGSCSYVKLKNNRDFHGLYQFIGGAGIETSEQIFEFASFGIGISMATVRGSNRTEQAENYMLSTSETEFGANAHLKLNILRFEKFIAGTRFYYDEIWTLPKSSSLLRGGIFVSYYL